MAFPLSDFEHAAIKSRIDGQGELIVAAAVRCQGVVIMVERPGRHGDCINFMHSLGLGYMNQGFVTNRGRFVDRREATKIVEAAGQGRARTMCGGALFSEDMWNDADVSDPSPIDPASIFGEET